MIRIHTAQLSVGKAIPRNGNVVFIDTTVRSGNDLIKENLAPTWDMVAGIKAGKLSESDYSAMYLDRIRHMNEACVHQFERLAYGEGDVTDVVLGCYCREGAFCHRHLLQRYLCDTFCFVAGWEVTQPMITVHEKPNCSVISIVDSGGRSKEDLQRILHGELNKGELRLIDRGALGPDYIPPAAEGAYDQALLGYICLSKLFRTRKTDIHDTVTCVDITYLTQSMYDVDYLERGCGLSGNTVPTTKIGGLVGEYFMGKRAWHIIRLPEEMSDQDIRKMVRQRGYTSQVTIGGA